MNVVKLKELLETIPADAEVTYRVYHHSGTVGEPVIKQIGLIFALGSDLWQIHIIKEYPGLPK